MGSTKPRRIITTFDPKPIPSRQWDWSAQTVNYDASWEGEETGYIASESVGYGATEQAAISHLQRQLDEEELAPVTVPEDVELEDLAFHRGNDWMSERETAEYESGMRDRDFR